MFLFIRKILKNQLQTLGSEIYKHATIQAYI